MKKTIFTLMAILLCSTASARNNPQVGTREGIVEGLYESGISIFKGIPFAAPPVGQLRWKAPQPAAHWAGAGLRRHELRHQEGERRLPLPEYMDAGKDLSGKTPGHHLFQWWRTDSR